jgi:RNA polymerase sigma factor (sigma-70 family)
MSDYRVKVTIRNNRLLKAIESKGFVSVQQFCNQYKLNYSGTNGYINGSIKPLNEKGEVKESLKQLLDILEISLEKAFTDKQLQGFKKSSFTIEAKESHLMQIASIKKPLEISLMEKDIRTLIDTCIYSLPENYRKVIRGVIFENKTVRSLAKELNVSTQRVSDLYKRGILKLRTSENFDKLIESGARDLFNNTKFVRFPNSKVSMRDDFGIKDSLKIKNNFEVKDNLKQDNLETIETMEENSFELNKGGNMTLEQLCEKMMDDWKAGNYTKAYNDYDALLSGREMKDIFIEEAKKKADVLEPGEIESYADHLEEAIDEGIANLQ